MSDLSITVTNVYAPSDHRHTASFLSEITDLAPLIDGPWVLIGDFNLIRCQEDKNNSNFNLQLALAFNDAIQNIAVSEFPLLDHRFT
jgi:hypothetical protein